MKDVFELLNWADGYLKKKKIATARIDAEILLSDILKIPRLEFVLLKGRKLPGNVIARFKKLIARHARYEPTAYILGNAEFMGLKFFVNKSVLIPRPETETLVEEIIERVKKRQIKKPLILDIGAGSGIIAVSLAKYIKDSKITAVDISARALRVALKNAKYNTVGAGLVYPDRSIGAPALCKGQAPASIQIKFVKGDLFDALCKQNLKFDIIVSNPPYVAKNEFKNLSLFIRKYEPVKALDGGADGLDIIRKITEKSLGYLKEGGFLALEVGYKQAKKVKKLMQSAGFENVEIVKDLSGIDRIVIGYKIKG